MVRRKTPFISVPFDTMQWIANTIGRLIGKKESERVCVMHVRQDDVRVDVSEYLLPSGHPGFRVVLEYQQEKPDHWIPIASLRDCNLDTAMGLLQEAKRCIGNLAE